MEEAQLDYFGGGMYTLSSSMHAADRDCSPNHSRLYLWAGRKEGDEKHLPPPHTHKNKVVVDANEGEVCLILGCSKCGGRNMRS